jgi:hypothetical protein
MANVMLVLAPTRKEGWLDMRTAACTEHASLTSGLQKRRATSNLAGTGEALAGRSTPRCSRAFAHKGFATW